MEAAASEVFIPSNAFFPDRIGYFFLCVILGQFKGPLTMSCYFFMPRVRFEFSTFKHLKIKVLNQCL